ncbi:MAG TPA: DUF1361 domain-containing protein [Candidatus Kapabacteria bacterium]|nr:DUF1361 domain-containing protein [Candidatus Kapabacteria bacterium]
MAKGIMWQWLKQNYKVALVCFVAFTWCSALVLSRSVWTGSGTYLFLGFNLGLAAFPLMFSTLAVTTGKRALRILYGCLWLLFFPNAPYIITDLMHLKTVSGAPVWFDVLMICSCAGTGLAFAYISLAEVHGAFVRHGSRKIGGAMVVFVCFAAAFGIYLGRFLRWHSVHLFSSPISILSDIADRFFNPTLHPRTWAFTLGFGTLLLLGYWFLKAGAHVLVERQLQFQSTGRTVPRNEGS